MGMKSKRQLVREYSASLPHCLVHGHDYYRYPYIRATATLRSYGIECKKEKREEERLQETQAEGW